MKSDKKEGRKCCEERNKRQKREMNETKDKKKKWSPLLFSEVYVMKTGAAVNYRKRVKVAKEMKTAAEE